MSALGEREPLPCGCAYGADGALATTCEYHTAAIARIGSLGGPPSPIVRELAESAASVSVAALRSLRGKARLQPVPPTEPPAVDVARALGESGVWPEFLGARLGDFPAKIAEALDPFLTGTTSAPGVLIKGPWGTGKTRLAVALFAAMLERRRVQGGAVVLARALRRRIVESYRDQSTERPGDVLDWFARRRLLVIDDLGHEGQVSEALVGDLHELLTRRRGLELPTVVTTNLGLEAFRSAYDGAIESRLAAYVQVQLNGEDRRKRRPTPQPGG